jgi:hypothetical protein
MKSLRNYDNNLSFWLLYCLSFYLRLLIVTLVFSIFSYINNIVKNPYQFAMICGVRVTRSVDICACCLSFCPFSFGHCGVRLSSINGFWLPLCYLQTLLCPTFVQIIAHCQFFSRHCLYKKKMDIPEAVNQRIYNIIVKMTSNDLHNNTQKTRDWETRTPQKKEKKNEFFYHL